MQPSDIAFDFLKTAKRPLIVVLGPTASGKTAFSITLALAIKNAEIVNADSRQLYRGMDIGTAKITPAEMRGVPHHLLSVLDVREELTVARYQKDAMSAIDTIHARGNVPMLVGGSMLYISSVIDGLQPLPAADPVLRAQLEADYDRDGGRALFAELADIDPASAKTIPRENRPYIVRAIEIHRLTGRPKSAQLRTAACPYDLLLFGMDVPRDTLNKRIGDRTHAFLVSGWAAEVRTLLDAGAKPGDPGMKSHGYAEIAAALQSGTDPLSCEPVIASKTRRYAKRQRTWWKDDPRIRWVPPT